MKLKKALSILLVAVMLVSVAPGIALPIRAADDYNLLTNGSFDQGNTGWANNGIAPAATIADGVLTLPAQKTASGDARTYQAMQLAPGSYQISFDVKGTPDKYRPYVGISKNYWTNDYGQYFMYNYPLSETAWTTVTETFTVPDSAAGADGLAPVYVTVWNSSSYAPLTEMFLDNFAVYKLMKVSAQLSNAALSAEIATVAQGQSYENTVTPAAGYEISKVTVTMGGTEVTGAYDPNSGKICIAAVTGDLHIQVEAAAESGNNLLTNGNFSQGSTGWASNGIAPAATIADGVLTLPAQKTASGDARTYQAMQLTPGSYQISFDVKGTPEQYRPYVGISKNYWTNDYGQYFMYNYALSDSTWTTVTEIFTVPDSAAEASGLAPVYVTVWSSNGSYGPLTEMSFDNFKVSKLLKVTTDLGDAKLSDNIAAVAPGQSYANTVTVDAGYAISKVTVTMGGAEVAGAYDPATGKISIVSVTADLHIRVQTVAESGKNLLTNGDFSQGSTGWAHNDVAPAATVADGVLTLPTEKTASGDARTYYAMQLAPGTYQLRFDAKGMPEQYRPYVGVSKNYWTNDYGQYFMYDYNLSDSTWTTVTEYITVPQSAADASGLAPVYVTVWSSNSSYAPATPMQLDNFAVYKCFDITVQNPDGKEATGLAEYTLPYAVDGQPFALTLLPETSEYTLKASCTMGGVNVPVTARADGSVVIEIAKASGAIVITVDSKKSAYTVTNGEGIANSNPAASVAHGAAYTANITSSDPNKKLYALTYTMGRKTVNVPVTDGAATISIDSVTGDITITAILVDKNKVAQWIFDVSKTVTGFGAWGDQAQTVTIAHNGYYDGKNAENGQPYCATQVAPDLLSITTNLPAGAAGWAEAATVIGYKLPADLELGETYIMNLPIYAGNEDTTLVSSKNKSKRSGMELVFTTVKPENMWNAGDKTVTRIYADGAGVLAASAPSRGKLTTDSGNVFRISFTVTEKIKEYAVSGNYLALIINHQHQNGSYQIGNAFLTKVTDPVNVKFNIGNSECDGPRVVQRGDAYVAKIGAKPDYSLGSVSYTMDGGKAVKVPVKDGIAKIEIPSVTGDIVITATTWSNKPVPKPEPKPAILGSRPNPSPYTDYPYICDEENNLMPNFGFELETNPLENTYSKIVADENAWEGKHTLHYAPVIGENDAENLLVNGDFAKWDKAEKTISGWEFNNQKKLDKLEFVELDGRNAVKLLPCGEKENFNLELTQRVYLEADFTYTFSFDFYGVAHWGPNLVIYDDNMKHISTMNAKTTGTEGQWTTLSTTYRPTESGYYVFAVRIHNAAYPQKEQFVSNCAVTLKSTRVEYELTELKPNTNYWLTLFVKAAEVTSLENSFITFGITVPATGDFIIMGDPTSEGGRPYKPGQQLVPMAYDGQWHILTVPFNTKELTELNFTIDGLNCEVWFDNIYIFEEAHAKTFQSPLTDKGEAKVTDSDPELLGCEKDKNLFGNFDLNDGDAFWGEDSHKFGVFGNTLQVADSGSRVYGKALYYASDRPNDTYYIKWIDVEPNTEYTFSAKYAIAQPGEGFMGLINGFRMESEVTENRVFPTVIQKFGFGQENYLENLAWQTAAVSFNSGERNRIGFVICDGGGEAYIDELRLFKSSDGIALEDVEDTLSTGQNADANAASGDSKIFGVGIVLWPLVGVLLAAATITVSLISIRKIRKNKQ